MNNFKLEQIPGFKKSSRPVSVYYMVTRPNNDVLFVSFKKVNEVAGETIWGLPRVYIEPGQSVVDAVYKKSKRIFKIETDSNSVRVLHTCHILMDPREGPEEIILVAQIYTKHGQDLMRVSFRPKIEADLSWKNMNMLSIKTTKLMEHLLKELSEKMVYSTFLGAGQQDLYTLPERFNC